MSLSLFPIAPQAPGLGLGAAASPEGAAAAGFDALLAALFGETGQAQPGRLAPFACSRELERRQTAPAQFPARREL